MQINVGISEKLSLQCEQGEKCVSMHAGSADSTQERGWKQKLN